MFKLLAVVIMLMTGMPATSYHGVRDFATLEECNKWLDENRETITKQAIDLAFDDDAVPLGPFKVDISCAAPAVDHRAFETKDAWSLIGRVLGQMAERGYPAQLRK